MFEDFLYLNLKDMLFHIQIFQIQLFLMIDTFSPDLDSAFTFKTLLECNDLPKQFTNLPTPLV